MSKQAIHSAALAAMLAVSVLDPATAAEATSIEEVGIIEGSALKAQSIELIETLRDIAIMSGNPGRDAILERALMQIERIDESDFARLSERASLDLGPLLEASHRVRRQMAGEFRKLRPSAAASKSPDDFQSGIQSAGFPQPGAVTAICDGVSRNAELRWSLLLGVSLAEEAVAAASRGCDEVIVIVGNGGNLSLVCLPLDIAFAAAKALFDLPQFCADEDDGALLTSVHDRAQHIHDDLEAARVEILANDDENSATILNRIDSGRDAIIDNDNANRSTIVANDNANRDTIVANDNANRDTIVANDNANRELIMAQIESLRSDLKALSCDMIRLLNTPEGRRASEIVQCQASTGFPFTFPER